MTTKNDMAELQVCVRTLAKVAGMLTSVTKNHTAKDAAPLHMAHQQIGNALESIKHFQQTAAEKHFNISSTAADILAGKKTTIN